MWNSPLFRGCSSWNTRAVVDHENSIAHRVTPIRFPIDFLTPLIADHSCTVKGMEFWPESKKIVTKFRRVSKGEVVGPSLTIGCS